MVRGIENQGRDHHREKKGHGATEHEITERQKNRETSR